MRAQTSLPALGVALLVLATTTGLAVAFADVAFAGADRDADQRATAIALSERLVSEDGPLTERANVLDEPTLRSLDERQLRNRYPVVGDRDVRLRLDDRTLLESGSPDDGTTIRRIVRIRSEQAKTYEPAFTVTNTTTVPRRTDRVRLGVDQSAATVEAVRVNDRIALLNRSGVRGTATVDVSRYETTTVAFEANGTLSEGDVEVTYYPARTRKAILEVTVGD